MASAATKQVRKLKELLSERQEPFILEAYLSDTREKMNSGGKEVNSSHFLKTSGGFRREKKSLKQSSRLLKAVFNKVSVINEFLRITNPERKTDCGSPRSTASSLGAEEDEASKSSSTASSSLAPGSSELKSHRDDREVNGDQKVEHRCLEESKQRSPVSVLEDVFSDHSENHSRVRAAKRLKVSDESILSASLWHLLLGSAAQTPEVGKLEDLLRSNPSPFLMSKRALQQESQLLLDFVREAIDERRREQRTRRCDYELLLGFEELGKIVCEKVRSFGSQSEDERSVPKLLELELERSWRECFNMDSTKKEVASEVADSVLEEMEDEIVVELVVSWESSKT